MFQKPNGEWREAQKSDVGVADLTTFTSIIDNHTFVNVNSGMAELLKRKHPVCVPYDVIIEFSTPSC